MAEDSLHSSLLIAEEQEQDNINGDKCEEVPRKADIDIPAISTFENFRKESWIECKKLWTIAGPAIFTSLCNYSIGGISQTFAGQLGTVNQAAVAMGNTVISTLVFGITVIAKDNTHSLAFHLAVFSVLQFY
ncbi:hypothetical protein SUGI_0986520 [Cryptomeria japonica]|nr:hypothetical protein SUGI_0986520 [Cryptomeria japonica]